MVAAIPKPLASLSSGLLARKGAAKPAMRPQAFVPAPAALDDLGWNDMGTPAPIPPVLAERAALTEAITPQPEPAAEAPPVHVVRSVSLATAARLRRETAHGGRAAFTLRLDEARHLQLRLASAITSRSAQQLMTVALDDLIAALPEVAALVDALPAATAKTRKR